MIWNLILKGFLDLVNILIGIFPNVDPSVIETIDTKIQFWANTINLTNSLLPIDQFFSIMAIIVGIEFVILAVKGTNIVINIITLGHIHIRA